MTAQSWVGYIGLLVEAAPIVQTILRRADHKNAADVVMAIRSVWHALEMFEKGHVTSDLALEHMRKMERSIVDDDAALREEADAKFGKE